MSPSASASVAAERQHQTVHTGREIRMDCWGTVKQGAQALVADSRQSQPLRRYAQGRKAHNCAPRVPLEQSNGFVDTNYGPQKQWIPKRNSNVEAIKHRPLMLTKCTEPQHSTTGSQPLAKRRAPPYDSRRNTRLCTTPPRPQRCVAQLPPTISDRPTTVNALQRCSVSLCRAQPSLSHLNGAFNGLLPTTSRDRPAAQRNLNSDLCILRLPHTSTQGSLRQKSWAAQTAPPCKHNAWFAPLHICRQTAIP